MVSRRAAISRPTATISHSLSLRIPQVQAGYGVKDDVETAEKLLAFLLRHEEGPFPSYTTATIVQVITVRHLDMCKNHMVSSLVLLDRHSMLKALLCNIVIILVQEVSFSELEFQLGKFKEKTQLVSNKSPKD
jgi:hypothetical protein